MNATVLAAAPAAVAVTVVLDVIGEPASTTSRAALFSDDDAATPPLRRSSAVDADVRDDADADADALARLASEGDVFVTIGDDDLLLPAPADSLLLAITSVMTVGVRNLRGQQV